MINDNVWRWLLSLTISIAGGVIIALAIVVDNKLNQIDLLTASVADVKADIKIIQSDLKGIVAEEAEIKGRLVKNKPY